MALLSELTPSFNLLHNVSPEKGTTSFTQVEVLVFKNTLVKVEVLTKLLYSSKSKEGFEMYFSKKYP